MRVLASLAGHKSLNTTMIYIETNDEIKRQAVELIDFYIKLNCIVIEKINLFRSVVVGGPYFFLKRQLNHECGLRSNNYLSFPYDVPQDDTNDVCHQ